jgi:hypothetical protein
MTPAKRLDPGLLTRIARATDKSEKYTREQISKRAARLGIAAEAAQIAWARELGIGTATALRRLPPHLQDQARSAIPSALPRSQGAKKPSPEPPPTKKSPDPVLLAADYIINDRELKSRCRHLLRRKKHLDTVLREATVVLEDRIRTLSGIQERLNPAPLISRALAPDPSRAILVVSQEPSEQQGFHNVCLGLVLTFRDPAHHALDDTTTREDALKFIGFIDVLLGMLGAATKRVSP